MTPQQQIIAEQIIKLHKQNDGGLHWFDLFYDDAVFFTGVDNEQRSKKLDLIKLSMQELGLIEVMNPDGDADRTRLTEKGFKFKSFKISKSKSQSERFS